jgi:uncharacterized protein
MIAQSPSMSITIKGFFMRLFRAVAAGLLISMALSACVPSNAPRSPAEIAAAQHAEALAGAGQFDQAAQAYLALAQQAPDRSDEYDLLAAEAYRQEGALDRAMPIVGAIHRNRLSGDAPLRLDLLRAEIALRQHDTQTALQLTTQSNASVPAALQPRLLELRAQALAASGDYWGAGSTRVQMDDLLHGFDRTQNRKQAVDLLAKLGATALKQRAAGMQPNDPMLPWVNQALTQLGVVVAQAQPSLGQPVGTLLPGANANVREGYKVPARIALILPDSDGLAAASSAIREGFFAAYFDAASNHAPRPSVRVYDSGGNAAGAVKAYQQAVADGAQLVVGPLTRPEVSAVFSQAQLPVPVLALNHPDDKSLPASGASEFALRPETEGAQVADHMLERGLHSAYVLTSDDDFARRAAEAFKAEFQAHGGTIAGSAQIVAGSVNYADVINGLNAGNAGSDAGVFISMRPEQARLLLPQLRVARIGLPVFGTSHIYAGVDNAGADNDLEGVEFCDSPWLFDAQPGLPKHDDIATLLPAARGASARLFAFGMDAWNLVPYIDWLRAHPDSYLPGASGQLAADSFGRVRRVLVWAKFQNGLARPLTGSLQVDNVPATPAAAGSAPAPAGSAPAPASSAPAPAGSSPLPSATPTGN